MTSGGRRGHGPGHDELLNRLCQQFICEQSGQFGREYQVAGGRSRSSAGCQPAVIPVPSSADDADHMVTALYGTHYRSLVGLAAVLVPDVTTAEEIVQDSFVAMHASWPYLAGNDGALPFLYHAVVTACEEAIRHGGASHGSGSEDVRVMPAGVVAILRTLPQRQREVLMLRFYADLSESQIASVIGTSKGAVRSLTGRAMSALRAGLRQLGD